ncbi:hypothetical protein TRFO_07550 [Tritrichomonas foetus]|uniref:Uncharacterized protein n=1 Tax=Tritrichomonas foetus TaxID=1144522 RepID=A0A1J4JSD4_9EUKA|nr:hypothetical protein TRFO_07550 [Tritrichomonas foetus]|eukprot:OHT01328.1 hypothetical protein TRFO_07550 [Tritrichomonas foetus]
MLDEFIEQLKEDDDASFSPSKGNYSPEKIRNSPKAPTKRAQSNTRAPPQQYIHEDDEDDENPNGYEADDDEEDIEDMPPPPQKTSLTRRQQTTTTRSSVNNSRSNLPTKKANNTRKGPANINKDEEDEEIINWSKKIKSIQNKGQNLDDQMQQCRSAIIDPPTDVADVPIYFGTSERKLDPYPTVKKKMTGGFIRPPPVRSSRKAGGPKGRRLLYEERVPDYVPPPERRRDALRWQIRQKLIYSDPKYH